MTMTFFICPWCGQVTNRLTGHGIPADEFVDLLVFEIQFTWERQDTNPEYPADALLNDHFRHCPAPIGDVIAGIRVEPLPLW